MYPFRGTQVILRYPFGKKKLILIIGNYYSPEGFRNQMPKKELAYIFIYSIVKACAHFVAATNALRPIILLKKNTSTHSFKSCASCVSACLNRAAAATRASPGGGTLVPLRSPLQGISHHSFRTLFWLLFCLKVRHAIGH